MNVGDWILRYYDHTTDRGPDDNGGIFLHALDADRNLFLAALLPDRLQRTHLDQGGALQPGSGGQYLQRAGRKSVDRDPRDPGFGAEDGGHGSVGRLGALLLDNHRQGCFCSGCCVIRLHIVLWICCAPVSEK